MAWREKLLPPAGRSARFSGESDAGNRDEELESSRGGGQRQIVPR
ncbi:protein of unknown function [Burkholderia multivorans]